MEPYRGQYARITRPGMRYLESYNASEGFFAVQDTLDSHGMLLLLGCGVFYEFIPVSQLESDNPQPIPAWQVEEGEVYSLVITSCNGLWRYTPGDTVRVESPHETLRFLHAFLPLYLPSARYNLPRRLTLSSTNQ